VVSHLHAPIPLEVMRFGCHTTLTSLGEAKLRDVPPSPEGNLIADYLGPMDDPGELASRLSTTPGVVDHGLFSPKLVSDILIAGPSGIEHRKLKGAKP
ncbi:MAG: ribose-5-phosphate isomerase A, partial [Solirubrobacteraceae bacterium]